MIEVLQAQRMTDGSILRAVRAATGRQPRWVLVWEVAEEGNNRRIELRPPGLGAAPRGSRHVERITAGPPDRPLGERRFHVDGDKERSSAIRLLAMRLRSGDGVFETKFALMAAFDAAVREDDRARTRAARRTRKWRTLAQHELADGQQLVHLQATIPEGQRSVVRGIVLRLGPRPALLDFWRTRGQKHDQLHAWPATIADPGAVIAAIGTDGDQDRLAELLVDVDHEDSLALSPEEVSRAWDLALRQDSLARGTAEGTVSMLQRPDARKGTGSVGNQARAFPGPEQHPVLVSLTLQVPAELAEDYRRRAQLDARLYLETHNATVSSIAGAADQVLSEEDEARRRARLMIPLAREKRPGGGRVAEVAQLLGLSTKQVYRQIAVLRKSPSWQSLVPKKAGRRPGHAALARAAEDAIGQAFAEGLDRPFAEIYRAVREIAMVAGAQPPDRKTVQGRQDAARKSRDESLMIWSRDKIWELAERWAGYGWAQGPGKASVLSILGREAQVWRDGDRWAGTVAHEPLQPRLKRDDARKSAVHRMLTQGFEERSGFARGGGEQHEPDAFWGVSDELVADIASDWSRTVLSVERRPYGWTGDLQLFRGPDDRLAIGLCAGESGRWSASLLEWADGRQVRFDLPVEGTRAEAAAAGALAAFRRFFAASRGQLSSPGRP